MCIRDRIKKALQNKDLNSLASYWLNGLEIDWSELYNKANRPNLITLPTYPFARDRYWYETHPSKVSYNVESIGRKSFHQIPKTSTTDSPKLLDVLKTHQPSIKRPLKSESNLSVIVAKVKLIFSQVILLPVEDLDTHSYIADLGVDSISGVEIVQLINEHFSASWPNTKLFEYDTIYKLSEFLNENIQKDFSHPTNEVVSNRKPDSQINLEQPKGTIPDLTVYPPALKEIPSLENHSASLGQYPADENKLEPTAIIGMASLFPTINPLEAQEKELLNLDKSWLSIEDSKILSNFQYLEIPKETFTSCSRQYQLILSALGKALKEGTIPLKKLSGSRTGVFIAIESLHEIEPKANWLAENHLPNLLPSKIAQILNLIGPCETVNSSCTSSFHALHKAVQSIEQGECEQAIVGGVNVITAETGRYGGIKDLESLLSDKYEMKSFDESADGMLRSEGVGVLIIRKKNRAEENKNKIYGLIRGTSFVHGGRSLSWEAPNPRGIKAAIDAVVTKSGIDTDTIDYIDAHGIANRMADAIELSSLNAAFKKHSRNPNKKWIIGCSKPYFGHSEIASGIASIVKVLHAFTTTTMPEVLGLKELNSEIDSNLALALNQSPLSWPQPNHARRAALNSYAVGGINAHVFLEEYNKGKKLDQEKLMISNSEEVPTPSKMTQEELKEHQQIKEQLLSFVYDIFKLKKDELDINASPIDYKFDSILVTQFVRTINEYYEIDVKIGAILNADTFKNIFDLFECTIAQKSVEKETIEQVLLPTQKIPLSEGQKGLWYKQTATPDSTNYNIPLAFSCHQLIDPEIIYQCVEQLIHRHPILKVNFSIDLDIEQIYQSINTQYQLRRDIEPINKDQPILITFKELLDQSFDLTKEVIRLFVRVDEQFKKVHLLLVIHHIVFDGISSTLFIAELNKLLQDRLNGIVAQKDEPNLDYFNFINWENFYLSDTKAKKDLDFWRQKLVGKLETIDLPFDKDFSTTQTGTDQQSILLSGESLKLLKETASRLQVNLSIFMLAIFNILIYRLTNSKTINITTPTAGRPKIKFNHSIGYFVNLMLVQSSISEANSFEALLAQIKKEFYTNLDYINYPFAKLLTDLKLGNQQTDNLLPITYNYQNIFDTVISEKGNAAFHLIEGIYQPSVSEYGLEILDYKDRLIIQLKYYKKDFASKTIKRHLAFYQRILSQVVATPKLPIQKLSLSLIHI